MAPYVTNGNRNARTTGWLDQGAKAPSWRFSIRLRRISSCAAIPLFGLDVSEMRLAFRWYIAVARAASASERSAWTLPRMIANKSNYEIIMVVLSAKFVKIGLLEITSNPLMIKGNQINLVIHFVRLAKNCISIQSSRFDPGIPSSC